MWEDKGQRAADSSKHSHPLIKHWPAQMYKHFFLKVCIQVFGPERQTISVNVNNQCWCLCGLMSRLLRWCFCIQCLECEDKDKQMYSLLYYIHYLHIVYANKSISVIASLTYHISLSQLTPSCSFQSASNQKISLYVTHSHYSLSMAHQQLTLIFI